MAKGDLIKARQVYKTERAEKTHASATDTEEKRKVIARCKSEKVGTVAMRDPDFQKHFCELLADGSTIRAALTEFGLGYASYYQYRKHDPEFAKMVDTAIDVGYDAIADECIQIADTKMSNKIDVMQAKLRIETRIEILQRKSRRYSNRQQVEVTDSREVEKLMRDRFTERIDTAKQAKTSLPKVG